MWMTKGYEERLAGMSSFTFYPYNHNPSSPPSSSPPLFFFITPRVYTPLPSLLFPPKRDKEG